MDLFWILHLTIFTLLHQTMSASDPTEVIKAVGKSVTFRSHNADGNAALWSFGNDPIVGVGFEDPPQPIFFKVKFKTRVAVSEKGRALSISQLTMEDAGNYSVKIGEKTSTFTLQVFRELPEPTVTCEARNCSGGSCSSSLRCSAPGAGLGSVSYTWTGRGRTWDGSSVVLLVNESSREEPEPLRCRAQNAVSSRSVTVTNPGELCAVALSSSEVRDWEVLLTILLPVIVLVLLAFGMFWIYKVMSNLPISRWKPADTAESAMNDYTTVYAEVGLSQQRVPSGAAAKAADGGAAVTIYSLVKRPEQADGGKTENATTSGLELV